MNYHKYFKKKVRRYGPYVVPASSLLFYKHYGHIFAVKARVFKLRTVECEEWRLSTLSVSEIV